MKIAKIDYINLLPFHIFLKRYIKSSLAFSAVNYKKSFPSKINTEFISKRANLAFISSVAATKANKTDIGIVAKNTVQSVIVVPGEYSKDAQSATSNILAKILNTHGNVYIGDKALKIALESDNYIDLAGLWRQEHNLPFVFAILCYNKNAPHAKKLAQRFGLSKIKIPQYVLEQYSKDRKISKQNILNYLTKISYKIGPKELLGYKKFVRLSKNHKL